MKFFQKGFTLAEILISLAIIGIIAAVVMPGLRSSLNKDSNALNLARSVELFQNGMNNIFNEVHSNNLEEPITELSIIQLKDLMKNGTEDFITTDFNLMDATKSFTNIDSIEGYDTSKIKDFSGNAINSSLTQDTQTYKFKKLNSVIIFQKISSNGIENAENDTVLTRVLIDTNGNQIPNKLGVDVFLFGLANNGHLVPAGSEAYNNNLFNETIESYTTGCNNAINTGTSCAARIMADGWKIKY